MMDILPMFPLNIVVLPGESLNLHIFEHRYRQLIHEADTNSISFGIPFVNSNKLEKYCPEMVLENIEKIHPDGKMDVTVKAVGLLTIKQFYDQHPRKLYPAAEIESVEIDLDPSIEMNRLIVPILAKMYNLLNVTNVKIENVENFATHQIAHKVGLTLDQEYDLLQMKSEAERARYLYDHLIAFLPNVMRTQELKDKALMNGHFQHHLPPSF